MRLPLGVAACLWSYDPRALEADRDRALIVTQVLNYGTWREVRWLFNRYKKRAILPVLKQPSRGSWLPDVLNFWTQVWGIRLPKAGYRRALFSLLPENPVLPSSKSHSLHISRHQKREPASNVKTFFEREIRRQEKI